MPLKKDDSKIPQQPNKLKVVPEPKKKVDKTVVSSSEDVVSEDNNKKEKRGRRPINQHTKKKQDNEDSALTETVPADKKLVKDQKKPG